MYFECVRHEKAPENIYFVLLAFACFSSRDCLLIMEIRKISSLSKNSFGVKTSFNWFSLENLSERFGMRQGVVESKSTDVLRARKTLVKATVVRGEM